jgi:hypothetical protein
MLILSSGQFHVLSLPAVTHVQIGQSDSGGGEIRGLGREEGDTPVQIKLASARGLGMGKWEVQP